MATASMASLYAVAVPWAQIRPALWPSSAGLILSSVLKRPSPVLDGAEICVASLAMAPAARARYFPLSPAAVPTLRAASLEAKTKVAAASPRLSPSLEASNERALSRDRALNDWNPDMMNGHNRSAPTTMAKSYFPPESCLSATIWAESPEMQAFDTVKGLLGLEKRLRSTSALCDRRSLSSFEKPSSCFSSPIFPFVVEIMKSTRGEEGSRPA